MVAPHRRPGIAIVGALTAHGRDRQEAEAMGEVQRQ